MAADKTPTISIEPLASRHRRDTFSCGNEALDRYLRKQAGQDARKNVTASFVLIEGENPVVRGFYTLSATSVVLEDLPEAITKKLPRYPLVPAILLGRLAVDQSRKGQGYGEILLLNALERCLTTKDIGWAVAVVDAKDEFARAFYERYEFKRFSPISRRMFLFRDTIERLLR
ncbi:MAG: GNAT family N-acetyltransferase [Candidatus Omnitrophica bacterium]|nr:GNAT family N-acetyltransferase [Candidatus Omnitrophota bacterium]